MLLNLICLTSLGCCAQLQTVDVYQNTLHSWKSLITSIRAGVALSDEQPVVAFCNPPFGGKEYKLVTMLNELVADGSLELFWVHPISGQSNMFAAKELQSSAFTASVMFTTKVDYKAFASPRSARPDTFENKGFWTAVTYFSRSVSRRTAFTKHQSASLTVWMSADGPKT